MTAQQVGGVLAGMWLAALIALCVLGALAGGCIPTSSCLTVCGARGIERLTVTECVCAPGSAPRDAGGGS